MIYIYIYIYMYIYIYIYIYIYVYIQLTGGRRQVVDVRLGGEAGLPIPPECTRERERERDRERERESPAPRRASSRPHQCGIIFMSIYA